MPERVEVNKTLRGRMNFKGRLFQKQPHSATKLQNKNAKLRPETNKPKKCWKTWFGKVLGLHLGRVWDALGCLGATFGRILNICWAFQLISFKNMGPRWAPRGLLNCFWIHFWEVSDLFWILLGAVGRFFWPSNLNFYKALVQHGLQVAFWIDFELILAGLGEDLDASW